MQTAVFSLMLLFIFTFSLLVETTGSYVADSSEIRDDGLRTREGRTLKFWGSHHYFEGRKNAINQHRTGLLSALKPKLFTEECVNVYLAKDDYTIKVSRPVYTDVDADEYPRAFSTHNLALVTMIDPQRSRLVDTPRRNTPIEVQFLCYYLNSGVKHPHWSVQIGDREFQIATDFIDTIVPGRKREGMILFSVPLHVAQKTMNQRNRENAWQIDAMAHAFDFSSFVSACSTGKSELQIWKDVNVVASEYLSKPFNEFFRNCLSFSLMLVNKVCDGDFTEEFLDDRLKAFGFQALTTPLGLIQKSAGTVLSLKPGQRDTRISVRRSRATQRMSSIKDSTD